MKDKISLTINQLNTLIHDIKFMASDAQIIANRYEDLSLRLKEMQDILFEIVEYIENNKDASKKRKEKDAKC